MNVASIIDSLKWHPGTSNGNKYAILDGGSGSIVSYADTKDYTIMHPLLRNGDRGVGPFDVLEAECILQEIFKEEGGDPDPARVAARPHP
jgi:hypothetical protein